MKRHLVISTSPICQKIAGQFSQLAGTLIRTIPTQTMPQKNAKSTEEILLGRIGLRVMMRGMASN